MLHEKRDKTLQIRLSDSEYADLQNYCSVNTPLSLSAFARSVLLSYIYEAIDYESQY